MATLGRQAAKKKTTELETMPPLQQVHTNKTFFKAVLDDDGQPYTHLVEDSNAVLIDPTAAGAVAGEYLNDGTTPKLIPTDESFMEVQRYKEDGITPILRCTFYFAHFILDMHIVF